MTLCFFLQIFVDAYRLPVCGDKLFFYVVVYWLVNYIVLHLYGCFCNDWFDNYFYFL